MAAKRVVVVGAGPGGLTAGMILARRGLDVTVFEARDVVGGRNAPIKADGYTFDTGPTFLMMNFILREMFEEAGRNVADYLHFKKLEPMYRLAFADRDVVVSSDHDTMREQIRQQFPGNEDGLDRFLAQERKRYAYLFPCIQKDYSTFASLVSWTLLRAIPYLSPTQSIFDNLGRYFGDEKLKLSFTFQAKYLGMSAWECPALFTMLPYVEHEYGIFHVIGGLNRISQAMAKVIEEHGGKIHTSTPVKSLWVEGRAVRGVRLENGESIAADDVVVNADFAHAMSHLVEPGLLNKYSRENLRKREYSCSTFMIYLGVKKRYDMDHHTIVFAKDYRSNVKNIFHDRTLSDDMSFYVQNASVTDPTLAPEGKSAIYILVPIGNRLGATDWTKEREPFKQMILDLVTRRTPMKDLRDQIEVERVITPLDWEEKGRIFLGATFNLSHTFSQLLYLRPRNRFEELDNCFLVGGGTHPGSGLPTIYESARISSNLLCRKHGIPFTPPSGLQAKVPVPG
jgi:phytoene desaturase